MFLIKVSIILTSYVFVCRGADVNTTDCNYGISGVIERVYMMYAGNDNSFGLDSMMNDFSFITAQDRRSQSQNSDRAARNISTRPRKSRDFGRTFNIIAGLIISVSLFLYLLGRILSRGRRKEYTRFGNEFGGGFRGSTGGIYFGDGFGALTGRFTGKDESGKRR